jgi:hypothetical protein
VLPLSRRPRSHEVTEEGALDEPLRNLLMVSPKLKLRVTSSKGVTIASIPLRFAGSDWQEIPYSFTSPVRDPQASIEISA